ncbi:MAG: DUF3617 domain-containing protein [Magnetococcus sp. DMHC-1]|nr:DUF3617 family protein [Magnetococcales bacterium]
MRMLTLALFVAALSQVTPAQSAELNAKEGLYEITINTEMPGMPMPSQSMRQCITQADIKNPQNIMKKAGQSDDCAIKNLQQESNKIAFSIACPSQQLSGQGEYRFSGESYSGTMSMTMPNPAGAGKPMSMTVKTTAKLVGPCK